MGEKEKHIWSWFHSKDLGEIQVKLTCVINLALECLKVVDKITRAQHFDHQGL